MSEITTIEQLLAEAVAWTQKQYTMHAGVPGTNYALNESRARMELIEHLKSLTIKKEAND